MSRLTFYVLIFILVQVLHAEDEDAARQARQRHRILHHRYPQTFRRRPGADAAGRKGIYRPNSRRPSPNFELPDDVRQQSWNAQSNAPMQGKVPPHHRRPVAMYGAPPVNWPIRPPPLDKPRIPNPHDIYGPPAEFPSVSDDDIRDDGLRADYEYEQYPEQEDLRDSHETAAQKKKAAIQKSDSYIGAEGVEEQPQGSKYDKIENFEIPLELLRGTGPYESI
uniref:Uncharacterized protein n=1 Tax=Ceratitis capitata TaxID=7213 RepID=W8BTM7_CERCA